MQWKMLNAVYKGEAPWLYYLWDVNLSNHLGESL